MFDYFVDDSSGPMEMVEELPRELAIEKGTCGAAVNGCAVNPYGDFLPCIQLMIPFGNVRERSLDDMWHNPPAELERVRETKQYGQIAPCASCDVVDYCHRCHGLAHLDTGRWDSCDRRALETAKAARAAVLFRRDGVPPDLPDSPAAVASDGTLVQIRI
jgi:radical SAM protein with 4Fe4S-binding SPASM domain